MTIKLIKRPLNGAEIRLDGRVDTNTAPAVENALLKIASEYQNLELNLSDLVYVSSAGLRTLQVLQKQVLRSGGSLALSHANSAVMEIFEMAGFGEVAGVR